MGRSSRSGQIYRAAKPNDNSPLQPLGDKRCLKGSLLSASGALGAGVMRRLVIATVCAAAGWLACAAVTPAAADVLVSVSKTSQRMAVMVDGSARYNWLISTGRGRYTTPSGTFQPQWMARKWRSKQYQNAPMPHSIFFHKGYAIHGTTEVSNLGRVASHGCVRLHPENAAKLYALIQDQMGTTRIVVSNDAIEAPGPAPAQPPKRPSQTVAAADIEPEISLASEQAERPAIEIPSAPEQVAAEKNPAARSVKAPARSTQLAARETAKASAPAMRTEARAASGGFRW